MDKYEILWKTLPTTLKELESELSEVMEDKYPPVANIILDMVGSVLNKLEEAIDQMIEEGVSDSEKELLGYKEEFHKLLTTQRLFSATSKHGVSILGRVVDVMKDNRIRYQSEHDGGVYFLDFTDIDTLHYSGRPPSQVSQ